MKDKKKPLKIERGHCPNCNAPPSKHELRNHSLMWHDGDIHCTICEAFVPINIFCLFIF